MVGVQRGLLIMMAAGAIALGPSTVKVAPPNGSAPVSEEAVSPAAVSYQVTDKEFYLASDQISYVRPGLVVKINSVTDMAPGKKPVVDLNIMDDFGNPLDRTGATTPGVISLRFVPAVWDAAAFSYNDLIVSGINPSRDTNGTWTTLDIGHYTYKFSATLPTFDPTMPMTLFVGGNRNVVDIIGKTYYVNTFKDFVPATGAAATTWGATTTDTCNECHDPVVGHGSNYREAKTCALCHNPVNMTGANAEFNGRTMFHKIHNGTLEEVGEITYPQLIQRCITCHDPDPKKAPNGDTWKTMPGRVACGSCHDNIDWVTGDNHIAGPQADDSDCASCHLPQGVSEFDASIKGAHTIPTKSAQLKGLKMQILSVTGGAPGAKVTVTFKVTNGDGSSVAPSSLGRLRFRLAGPTTDYTTALQEDGVKATASGDAWVYTFTSAAIPADATGSWGMSADCYRTVTIDNHSDTGLSVREAAVNPIYYFAVTDSQPVARRTVVDIARCNSCHDVLALHGGQRFKIEECVICHNPVATTESVQGQPDENINLNRMVHRIHTGEELTHDYSIGGNSFNEVRYPGDRRDCVKCHVSGTYTVPLPEGVIPTITPRDFYTPMQPTAAACLGCHDSKDAAIHAMTMTNVLGESCEVCHSNDAEFAVDKVHAR